MRSERLLQRWLRLSLSPNSVPKLTKIHMSVDFVPQATDCFGCSSSEASLLLCFSQHLGLLLFKYGYCMLINEFNLLTNNL